MLIRAFVGVHYTVPALVVGPHKVLMEPALLEKWKTLGFDPIGSTTKVFAERQKADHADAEGRVGGGRLDWLAALPVRSHRKSVGT